MSPRRRRALQPHREMVGTPITNRPAGKQSRRRSVSGSVRRPARVSFQPRYGGAARPPRRLRSACDHEGWTNSSDRTTHWPPSRRFWQTVRSRRSFSGGRQAAERPRLLPWWSSTPLAASSSVSLPLRVVSRTSGSASKLRPVRSASREDAPSSFWMKFTVSIRRSRMRFCLMSSRAPSRSSGPPQRTRPSRSTPRCSLAAAVRTTALRSALSSIAAVLLGW